MLNGIQLSNTFITFYVLYLLVIWPSYKLVNSYLLVTLWKCFVVARIAESKCSSFGQFFIKSIRSQVFSLTLLLHYHYHPPWVLVFRFSSPPRLRPILIILSVATLSSLLTFFLNIFSDLFMSSFCFFLVFYEVCLYLEAV